MRVVAINEKVTGPAGKEMLRRSGLTTHSSNAEGLEILDNACGGGIMASELLSLSPKPRISRIIAGDNDKSMLSYVRDRAARSSGWESVEVKEIDQTAIPFPEQSFDYIFNNFGIFFHPADDRALAETYRALKPNGVAGFTSWKSISWWPAVALPALKIALPNAPPLPPTVAIFPAPGWTETSSIPPKLEEAGFKDVEVSEFAFAPRVPAKEFAESTAVLVKVVMKRLWSEGDFRKFEERVEGAILNYLTENWEDGVWDGEMVAIVTTGRKG